MQLTHFICKVNCIHSEFDQKTYKVLTMKKTLLLCIISSTLTTMVKADVVQKTGSTQSSVEAGAATKSITESVKIRYVDPYRIIPKLEQGNDERMKIQKELENRSKQIEDLKLAYTTKANELQSKGNMLNETAKATAIKELNRLETDIKFEQQSFQEIAERASQEAQMTIFREIEAAAKEYAQANGIDFVFAGGAIYVNEKYDISDTIADIMNKKYLAQKTKNITKAQEAKRTI